MLRDYKPFKSIAFELAQEILTISRERYPLKEEGYRPVHVGKDYSMAELKGLTKFEELHRGLQTISNVQQRIKNDSKGFFVEGWLTTLIIQLIEATLSQSFNDEVSQEDFTYWWKRFCKFLDSKEITERTLIGLGNIDADAGDHKIAPNTHLVCFGEKNLCNRYWDFSIAWDRIELSHDLADNQSCLCNAVLKIDRRLPNSPAPLMFDPKDTNWTQVAVDALRIAGYGRLVDGPTIEISNPNFPNRPISIYGEPDFISVTQEQVYRLTPNSLKRIRNVHNCLVALMTDKSDDYIHSRNKLKRAIYRFSNTFREHETYKLSYNIIDLVSTLESLYSDTKSLPQSQTILSISNLLGTNETEVQEIVSNLRGIYKLRNSFAHGTDPAETEWKNTVHSILSAAGLEVGKNEISNNKCMIEIIRDYARRSIHAMLNLHYGESKKYRLGKPFYELLQELHFRRSERKAIQAEAKCYPLMQRTSP